MKVSRLIKRRTVACDACNAGRVTVNGKPQKASYDVKVGDRIEIKFGEKSVQAEVLAVEETVRKETRRNCSAISDGSDNMAGRRKSRNLNSKLPLLGITLVVGVLAFAVGIRSQDLREKEQTYLMREDTLQKEIANEEQRTEDLNEKKVYVKTKQYIEEVARDKLGLVNPDEIILKEN